MLLSVRIEENRIMRSGEYEFHDSYWIRAGFWHEWNFLRFLCLVQLFSGCCQTFVLLFDVESKDNDYGQDDATADNQVKQHPVFCVWLSNSRRSI